MVAGYSVRETGSQSAKCIPTYMVSPFFSNGITMATFRHGPQIIHIYMDERGDGLSILNQPHGWKYFLSRVWLLGCCVSGPARFASAGSSNRSWNSLAQPVHEHGCPASWTRTVAVVCTSRSRPPAHLKALAFRWSSGRCWLIHRRGDVHRSP